MEPALPDIVQYAEYRTYLKDRYQAMRASNRKFSHRYIAAKSGSPSAGWFSDLVAGRQKLKPAQLPKVAAVFRLDVRESEFLAALVEMERAANPVDRVAAMEKWLLLKGFKKEKIEKDRFAYFEHWHNLALRELLTIRCFDGDYAALGASLIPPVDPDKVEKAVDLLQRLGLIQPQAWNRRMGDVPVLIKAPSPESKEWNRILQALGRLAAASLDHTPKAERNVSALTLTLSPEGLAKAGEEIANLRKRLLMIAEKDRARNRVYQCLFQVFPLSLPQEAGLE